MANVVVNLLVNSTGLNAATARIRTFQSGIKSAFSPAALGLTAGVAAIAAAATAITASVLTIRGAFAAIARGGELNDLSARTGIAVEEIFRLQRSFANSGVAADQLAPAIARMQKALSGFGSESGKAEGAIKRLGLDISKLRNQDPGKSFREVGRAIASVSNPAQQAALAMDIFGRNGAELLKVFNDPFAFEQLPASLQRQATLLDRNAALFDRLGDSVADAQKNFFGFFVGFADRLAPEFEKLFAYINSIDFTAIGESFGDFTLSLGDAFNAFFEKIKQYDLYGLLTLGIGDAVSAFIGELQIGELKVKEIVAMWAIEFDNFFIDIGAIFKKIGVVIELAFKTGFESAKAVTASALLAIAEEINKFSRFLKIEIPTDGLKKFVADSDAILKDQLNKLAAIDTDVAKAKATNKQKQIDIAGEAVEREIQRRKAAEAATQAAREERQKQINAALAFQRLDTETKTTGEKKKQVDLEREAINLRLQDAASRISNINQNPTLSPEAKMRELNAAYREQAEILRQIIDLNERKLLQTRDPQERLQIQSENNRLRQQQQQAQFNAQNNTFGGQVFGGLKQYVDSIGTTGQQVANLLTNTIGTAVNGVSQGIIGLINGTATWGQTFAQVGQQILASLVQMLMQMTVMKIFSSTAQATSQAQAASTGAAMTASYAPAAAAASVASFGSAGIIGTIAAVAAIGAIIAALTGGFAEGGLVPGAPSNRDNRIASIATGEYVARAAAVQYYGAPLFDALNTLSIPRQSLEGMVTKRSYPVRSSAYTFATGGLAAPIPHAEYSNPESKPVQVHIVQMNNRQDLKRYMQTARGQKAIVDANRRRSSELGI